MSWFCLWAEAPAPTAAAVGARVSSPPLLSETWESPLAPLGVLGFGRPPPLHANGFPGGGVGTCSKQAVALMSLWRGAGALLVAWWWRAVQKP